MQPLLLLLLLFNWPCAEYEPSRSAAKPAQVHITRREPMCFNQLLPQQNSYGFLKRFWTFRATVTSLNKFSLIWFLNCSLFERWWKNGKNAAVLSISNITSISYAGVQFFQCMHCQIFCPITTAMTAFSTNQFRLIPSTQLLCRLMVGPQTRNNNIKLHIDELHVYDTLDEAFHQVGEKQGSTLGGRGCGRFREWRLVIYLQRF
jgi:hypothetical protein